MAESLRELGWEMLGRCGEGCVGTGARLGTVAVLAAGAGAGPVCSFNQLTYLLKERQHRGLHRNREG